LLDRGNIIIRSILKDNSYARTLNFGREQIVGQVTGTSSQADVPAVSGSNSGAEGLAGHFDGNVTINGILIASGAVPATGGIVGAVNSSSGAGVEGFSVTASMV
jgi:hypothetical protein